VQNEEPGQSSLAVFRKLTEGLVKVCDHRTIDNCDSTFMPVVVEVVDSVRLGLVVSVAHYFEQNSDLMADPEVTFLVTADEVFPLTFYQPPFSDVAAKFEDGRLLVSKRRQGDLTRFCNQWMRNIAEQQDL
jgi:hypothetical protein